MIYINVNIQVHYRGSAKFLRTASLPLRGKTPEQVAYDFWIWIQKEHPFEVQLEKVILNSEEDITDKVRELENSN